MYLSLDSRFYDLNLLIHVINFVKLIFISSVNKKIYLYTCTIGRYICINYLFISLHNFALFTYTFCNFNYRIKKGKKGRQQNKRTFIWGYANYNTLLTFFSVFDISVV